MNKVILLAAMLLLIGCGESTTVNNTTTVTQGDNGVYINNGDGTVTYVADSYNEGQTSEDFEDEEYDSGDDAVECKAKGFFWCPITKTCNNTSGSGGTCSGRK